MKTVGGFRRTRYRGLERTQLAGYLVATAYNLVRMVRLVSSATASMSSCDPRGRLGRHHSPNSSVRSPV